MPTKNGKRVDYVPAEPIRRALREWLQEYNLESRDGNKESGRYYSPLHILSERTGLREDTIWRHIRKTHKSMCFDVADRFLCATGRAHWWWQDPELAPHYGRACRGADRVYPIPLEVAA